RAVASPALVDCRRRVRVRGRSERTHVRIRGGPAETRRAEKEKRPARTCGQDCALRPERPQAVPERRGGRQRTRSCRAASQASRLGRNRAQRAPQRTKGATNTARRLLATERVTRETAVPTILRLGCCKRDFSSANLFSNPNSTAGGAWSLGMKRRRASY